VKWLVTVVVKSEVVTAEVKGEVVTVECTKYCPLND
jgi:hypothetical protein